MGYVSWNDAQTVNGGVDTNQVIWSSDLTKPDWAKTTMTVTPNISDPFGGLRAFTLTATGAVADIRQFLAVGASLQRVNTMWIRRRTGVGAIRIIDPDGGGTLTVATTAAWQRFAGNVPAANTARYCGMQIVTNGDAVDVYCPQLQDGTVPSDLDILTYDVPATALSNGKPRPGDRLANWHPSGTAIADEEEALGTGQLYTFTFRDEYLVTFDLKPIPQSSVSRMLRLQRQLKKAGTVNVTTGDTSNRVYPTCCAIKGADPAPRLADPKLLEYSMTFQLRNVDASPTDFLCIY